MGSSHLTTRYVDGWDPHESVKVIDMLVIYNDKLLPQANSLVGVSI